MEFMTSAHLQQQEHSEKSRQRSQVDLFCLVFSAVIHAMATNTADTFSRVCMLVRGTHSLSLTGAVSVDVSYENLL